MAIQAAKFYCTGIPDYGVLQDQMARMPGITRVAIDRRAAGVTVDWEDTAVTPQRIELMFNALGYRKCRSI